jgi:hypothetical protein
MTSATPPAGFVHIVVGYDGSAPASRALDAAVRLLQGRAGRIVVIYVAHLSSLVMMSADAIAEMESDFDEVETELRTTAAEQLRGSGAEWEFERRQGVIPDQLIATAAEIRDAHPGAYRGDRARQLVSGRPPNGRLGGGQPGPPLAGTPSDRAVDRCPGRPARCGIVVLADVGRAITSP